MVTISEALALAEEAELDLVEVAPQGNPPVCRILNYGKYRFQQQKRDKDARKKQKTQAIKEVKMRPKIDQHDYDFKVKNLISFLESGHKVKVAIFFRGREMAFLDRGRDVLNRVVEQVKDYGKVEAEPRMEGSYMRMMLAPLAASEKPKPQKNQKAEAESTEEN